MSILCEEVEAQAFLNSSSSTSSLLGIRLTNERLQESRQLLPLIEPIKRLVVETNTLSEDITSFLGVYQYQ